MKKLQETNLIAYVCMMIGVVLLLLQQNQQYRFFQEQGVLIGGLVFLVVGIYLLAKKLPRKGEND